MVMSDLNMKLKLMDEEKQSLVLPQKILQEKEIINESGDQKSVFTEVVKNRNSRFLKSQEV